MDPKKIDGGSISPNQAYIDQNPQAKLGYVEVNGKPIELGSADLERIEARMHQLGAQILVKKPGNETATAKSIDSAKEVSDLQSIVCNLETGVEEGFRYIGHWEGIELEAVVDINTDFGLSLRDAQDLDNLFKARASGDIDRKTYLLELQRRGVLDEEHDIDDIINITKTTEPPTP